MTGMPLAVPLLLTLVVLVAVALAADVLGVRRRRGRPSEGTETDG